MGLITLFILNLIIGTLATWVFELILKTNKKLRDRYYKRHEILFGYHVHHSTIGLVVITVGGVAFLSNRPTIALGMAGFGIGIIIMHTISLKRFVFAEKETFTASSKKLKQNS